MRCPTCGAETPEKSLYCGQCGGRLDAVPGSPGSKTVPAPAMAAPSGDASPTVADRFARTAEARRGAANAPDESVWEGGFSGRAMIPSWIGAGLLTLALLAIGLLFPPVIWIVAAIPLIWIYLGLLLAYRKLAVRYKLTTFRFFHETGILKRTMDRIEVIDIDDITVVQNVIERMLNVGQIRVSSSDRTHPVLLLRGIDKVRDVATQIDRIRRAERTRRGLHIEMV